MQEIGNAGNIYIDERAPWSLFKQGGAASEAAAKVSFILPPFLLRENKNRKDISSDFLQLKLNC